MFPTAGEYLLGGFLSTDWSVVVVGTYRTRELTVEARQLTKSTALEIHAWVGGEVAYSKGLSAGWGQIIGLYIPSFGTSGFSYIGFGDWVIKDSQDRVLRYTANTFGLLYDHNVVSIGADFDGDTVVPTRPERLDLMSADIYLVTPGCECCGSEKSTVDSMNLTYNLNTMLAAAGMWSWREFVGLDAHEAGAVWEMVVLELKSDPEWYKTMEPINGWGSYNLAIETLERFSGVCLKSKTGKIEAWL